MWTAIFQAVAAGFEFMTALVRRNKKTTEEKSTDSEVDAAPARGAADSCRSRGSHCRGVHRGAIDYRFGALPQLRVVLGHVGSDV